MVRIVLSLVAVLALVAATGSNLTAQTKTPAAAGAKPASPAVVNINTASATEIATLPGVGAKMAARIIEYRQKNGPFKKIEELMNVRGIGEKNFLKLKPQITVAPSKTEHATQPGH